jgi:hypothetical protein
MTHPDDLQQRYAEANALDDRRPAPHVRDAALAHANMVLANQKNPDATTPAPAQKRPSLWAANLPSWKAALVASVLLAPLLGILVMRSERELPPGEQIAMQSPFPSPPLSKATDAAAPPMAESTVTPSARAPAAPAPARATAPVVAATTNTTGNAKSKETQEARVAASAASPAVGIATASAERADMSAPAPLAAAAPIQSGSLADSALQAKRAVGAGAAARAEPSSLNDALLQAVRAGQAQALEALVGRGASVDARDAAGKTALLLAVQSGDEATTKALLKLGANPDLADPHGVNALQLARQLGHAKIIALLENRRASQP